MGTSATIHDTVDELILKLKAAKESFGGNARIQLANPKIVDIPYDREEYNKGLWLKHKKGPLYKTLIICG